MIPLLGQSQLPTTEIMLFGATILGLLAALRAHHVTAEKNFTKLFDSREKDISAVVKSHEKVADKIVSGLGGVKDSVDGLTVKVDRHSQRIRDLITHVKGSHDDDDSN